MQRSSWKLSREFPPSAGRGLRFTYQKFSDHILVRHLLEKHLDRKNPRKSFKKQKRLGVIIQDPWRYRGLIDAIVIELPEWTNRELFELVPKSFPKDLIVESTIRSMVWRDPSKFKKVRSTLKLLTSEFPNNRQFLNEFLKTLISVATVENHPLNGRYLHKKLIGMKMPRRDYIWTQAMHSMFEDSEQIKRLLRWGHQARGYSELSENSALLGAIALGWFLTSSNRFLRDKATKALLATLSDRIPTLIKLLRVFESCDDPYVIERLLAIAYGCVTRSTRIQDTSKLAKYIYSRYFINGNPPLNILSRDYARGIVLCAKDRNPRLKITEKKLKPPFQSRRPKILSDVQLRKYEVTGSHTMDPRWAQWKLYQSVKGFEDFSRYVLGSDHRLTDWVDPNGRRLVKSV
jgi:hypothetical protein